MERQVLLSKQFRFEAAHSLPGHRGKCARVHGHSYQLEVTLRGPIKRLAGASDDGMVMDFADLSQLVQQAVLDRLDHQDLNEVTGVRTTAENLVHWIWEALLTAGLPAALLYRLCLWETAQCRVEITAAERVGED
ncbi:MAG TPA: 6-carboxytetrahydropterin synthase QueD [Ktedonobacteraceae bacterium]|jgi:6-pyruvoyltetrahydropterin/6-carboxytetrahydropterin synthase